MLIGLEHVKYSMLARAYSMQVTKLSRQIAVNCSEGLSLVFKYVLDGLNTFTEILAEGSCAVRGQNVLIVMHLFFKCSFAIR